MLENKQLESLTMHDQKRIVDSLLPFLDTIPDLPSPIKFGVLHKQCVSMCVQFLKSEVHKRQDITGGYTGSLYFSIWYRFQEADAATELYGSKVMYQINEFFDSACENNALPVLGDDMQYLKIGMIELPTVERKIDNMLDCMAIFECRIEHQ